MSGAVCSPDVLADQMYREDSFWDSLYVYLYFYVSFFFFKSSYSDLSPSMNSSHLAFCIKLFKDTLETKNAFGILRYFYIVLVNNFGNISLTGWMK